MIRARLFTANVLIWQASIVLVAFLAVACSNPDNTSGTLPLVVQERVSASESESSPPPPSPTLTATPSLALTGTFTPSPSQTPLATPPLTSTPVTELTPTPTSSPQPTPTPVTVTPPLPTPTPTNRRPFPPTPTPTSKSDATPVSSSTPISPSATPTATPETTATPTSSSTPSPTPPPQLTPTPVTATPQIPTPTPTPTPIIPTATPKPKATATRTPSPTPSPSPTPLPTPTSSDERFGVILHSISKSDSEYFLDQLGVNWYIRFDADQSKIPGGANKVPFIQVPAKSSYWTDSSELKDLSNSAIAAYGFFTRPEIQQMVQAAPGSYWYIFGEPNRYSDPNLTGARFATVFDYFATEIKQADPTAKIVSPSILNWETVCGGCWYPPGLDWLSEFIAAYQGDNGGALPPVDIWAIDLYPIDWFDTPNSEAHAPTVFDQLAGFRGYLNGFTEYANTPIWITAPSMWATRDGRTALRASSFPSAPIAGTR